MRAVEGTAAWRRMGDFFLTVCVPLFHWVGGLFILQFVLSGDYTWGRTLRTFVLFMSNMVMGYEFVYRELQRAHPAWTPRLVRKGLMKYSVIPFALGMATVLIYQAIRYWGR